MDQEHAEQHRLEQDTKRQQNWKRWGPYLSERQWATVREDYSADGDAWDYFPHDHARSRAYRWGEDGLLGITDRECRLCLAVALWNGRDPILKERLFGLTNLEGNHGEDVKEAYYYIDATPTYSYMKALYRYPQGEFPYRQLVEENRRRTRNDPEFELVDTGVFQEDRFFDVLAEYAKAGPDDILIRFTVANRGPQAARLDLLPTLWFRNTWTWGCLYEGCWLKPRLWAQGPASIRAEHATLEPFVLECGPSPEGTEPELLFTENESNAQRLWQTPNHTPFVKDAFHEYLIARNLQAVNPARAGTKVAAHYVLEIPPGQERQVRLRLHLASEAPPDALGEEFGRIMDERCRQADAFYRHLLPGGLSDQERTVARQAYAGLLWTRQFYNYVVKEWLDGDPNFPPPPPQRRHIRNTDWTVLFNRDVISVPDKWEYPWYAAWDLAFHMLPFSRIDPDFAKSQLVLFLREWYMHPNGHLPAYEYNLPDVNPPVHAWSCWRVYQLTARNGQADRLFLARVFPKLLINFTWWVNRKDPGGRNLFTGGFLGLDNIGVFDRSRPLPTSGQLEQADSTAWMAFYCTTMLSMALELAREDPAYEDIASKFFEHFVAIADAMNSLGGTGLWDDQDGFYYDQIFVNGRSCPLRLRSLVGLIPILAVNILPFDVIQRLAGFRKRMTWFLENRRDLATQISYMETRSSGACADYLLAIPSRERLERVLRYALDENEFLSPFGLRSLSRAYKDNPFVLHLNNQTYTVEYAPGESNTDLFGGNSNWRGPVWMPLNFLFLEALERYHQFYGDSLAVECPVGSGVMMNLQQVAGMLCQRLTGLFVPDPHNRRPFHGPQADYSCGPHWKDLVLFHEYFHAETGQGLGASHQTGWTSLITLLLERVALWRPPEKP